MNPPRVLGLDLGSSSVRAAVFDKKAEPVSGVLARRKITPAQGDDGRAELDPEAYVAGLVECLDELAEQGALDGVDRVAAASQWHSVLAVDKAGEPRSAVLTWLDTRARVAPDATPADPDAFHARTGSWVHPLYWTAKVPWLRAQLSDDGLRFVGLPDHVRGVLLGDDATSASVAAGTGLLDLARCRWDDEAVELAGLSASALPAIDDEPRRLAESWRDRWPALADALWHPVLGDGAASNLGSGCATADTVAVTVGTSAALRVVHTADGAPPPPRNVWRYRVDPHRLVSGIAFSGGGVLHAWAVRLLSLGSDAEPTGVRPGSHGLLSVPLHAGSRPPDTTPPGSGVVVGLSLDTSPDELLAATLEGVALEAAQALETLETSFGRRLEVVLGGGAAHASAWWRQVFAAVLDRPVRLASDPEVGARGAAAHALGLDLPPPAEVVHPDTADAERMVAVRARYARLRSLVPDVLDRT